MHYVRVKGLAVLYGVWYTVCGRQTDARVCVQSKRPCAREGVRKAEGGKVRLILQVKRERERERERER